MTNPETHKRDPISLAIACILHPLMYEYSMSMKRQKKMEDHRNYLAYLDDPVRFHYPLAGYNHLMGAELSFCMVRRM